MLNYDIGSDGMILTDNADQIVGSITSLHNGTYGVKLSHECNVTPRAFKRLEAAKYYALAMYLETKGV